MRKRVGLLALGLAVGSLQAPDQTGVYGYVRRVTVEPNAEHPKRILIWGTFSVAVPGLSGDYHAPERGYLYFELPTNPRTGLIEWADLTNVLDLRGPWIGATGKHFSHGIVGFGRRGSGLRVRTSDEKPDRPDVYVSGQGLVQVSRQTNAAPIRMLGGLFMNVSSANYALVDKVVLEPPTGRPERIQIWGAFVLGVPDSSAFAAPQRGYFYLAMPANGRRAEDARVDWNEWQSLAGTREVAQFFTFEGPDPNPTLRPLHAVPQTSEPYTIRMDASYVRSDSPYAPIKALLAFR